MSKEILLVVDAVSNEKGVSKNIIFERRAVKTRRAPSAAKSLAQASPKPAEAPVIKIVFTDMRNLSILLGKLLH